MKHAAQLLLAVFIAGYLAVALSTRECPFCVFAKAFGKTEESAPAEVLTWAAQDLDGNPLRAADCAGKVTIVNFWATWCAPCRAEIPDFIALQEEYRDAGVRFVGISLDDLPAQELKRFAEKQKINYPLAFPSPSLRAAFGEIRSIPATFVLDREGRVAFRKTGMIRREELEPRLRRLL